LPTWLLSCKSGPETKQSLEGSSPGWLSAWNVGELLDRGFVQIALLLQQRRDCRVGARDFHHAAHFRDGVDVGLFEETLADHGFGVGLRAASFARRVEVETFLEQFL